MVIREYVEDYVKYFPERWRWSIKNSVEQHELYMSTRARRCKNNYSNCDLLPDFTSIERDAAQFGFCKVEWTDFFGIVWEGEKGVHAYAGAPDYEGSLYFTTTMIVMNLNTVSRINIMLMVISLRQIHIQGLISAESITG